MKAASKGPAAKPISGHKKMIFPGCMLIIYGVLFIISPDKTAAACRGSFGILLSLLIPLSLIYALIVFMNLFLKPAHIIGFLGKESGGKGVILSAVAGIISMGPIYAWYPLLQELRKKGATNSVIAVFLCNRAVKPFLLPIMISYFGWVYVALLTLFTMSGSLAAGYTINILLTESIRKESAD